MLIKYMSLRKCLFFNLLQKNGIELAQINLTSVNNKYILLKQLSGWKLSLSQKTVKPER